MSIQSSYIENDDNIYNFGGSFLGNSRVKLTNVDDCIKNNYIKKGQIPLEIAAQQLINDKVDINKLTEEDIQKVNKYFLSMNYEVCLDVFPTMNEYIFKHPNYFKDQKHITNQTMLKDYYYEVYGKGNCVFRISFKKLV